MDATSIGGTAPCAIVPLPQAVDPSAVFTPVGGQPALVRIVRSLLAHVDGVRVVVSATPALVDAARDCLRSAELTTVVVAVPGERVSRRHVLIAGLEHLGVQAHSRTPVLIGDHRHPLTPSVVTASVLARLRGGDDVVVPVLPVTDTVKTVNDVGSVLTTVDRSALRTVQYPRGFTASALWELVSAAAPADADVDEFTVALRTGLAIATVGGDAGAFQVELPRDAHLLDAIIACRPR